MNYQEFKTAVIAAAKDAGLNDYELYCTESSSTSVETIKTELKAFSTNSSLGVCFRCIADGHLGYASTQDLTAEEASLLVTRAIENASSIEKEEPAFLHGTGDQYQSLTRAPHETPSSSALIDYALSLQSKLISADSRVLDNSETACTTQTSFRALCNSKGLDLSEETAFDYAYASAIVSDGSSMYDGFSVGVGALAKLSQETIVREAVEEAISSIGYTSVPSGKYSVVFSGRVIASLLSAYASVFSAENAQKGLSLLAGKEGSEIAASIVTLTDDPLYPDAPTPCTFDAEGVATCRKNVIEQGRLTTLLHNLTTAAAAGVKTTGNAYKASYASSVDIRPYSFYLNPGEASPEDLFAEAENGITITSIEGLHAGANPISGDFSLSSGGYRIENGKKAGPIKNFTVSGNFFTLLKEIERIGNDLTFQRGVLGSCRCGSPSLLVRNMTIAGKDA